MNKKKLVEEFPKLRQHLKITSPPTPLYNCIAWAAGDSTRRWWPHEDFYWPEGAPNDESVASFQVMFGLFGYVSCTDARLEKGIEKIIIYSKNGKATHAARQLPNGKWTSKLGHEEDIEHHPPGVEGEWYGRIAAIMKRKRP